MIALQTADGAGVSTPEGWKPGEPVMALPPVTAEEAERHSLEDEAIEWYYRLRKL